MFFPALWILATPKDAGLEFEDIFFTTEDRVRISGWLVKAAKNPDKAATVLFFHGNAGNIGDRVEKIRNFHDMGLNVFIVDYRGFGKSEGRPSERGMYLDAQAAYDYLAGRTDIDKKRIIVYGASMGGVAAIDLAARRPVAGLIADSTITNAADMAKKILPFIPTFLLNVKLDNIAKIPGVTAPKLFIHSPDDEMVPFRLGQKLFDAAAEPKEFLTISGTHNEGYALSERLYVPGVEGFLDKYKLR